MDTVKIGKFIASLRKDKSYTQEQLGEKLGVTGKTVSRWETGAYLPPVEILQLLSAEFQVSINELLSGERLSDSDFRARADENLIRLSKESAFSLAEKRTFLIRKWRKEHISLFVLLIAVGIAAWIIPFVIGKTYLLGLAMMFNILEYGWQNNRMMLYVEDRLYGRKD